MVLEPKREALHRTLRSDSCPGAARGASLIGPPIFEQRIDPVSGRRVFIAEDRSGRPSDFGTAKPPSSEHVDCPFCAGNEHTTPKASFELPSGSKPWQVRVVPNKYPAVSFSDREDVLSRSEVLHAVPENPAGAHEVIIESPHHVQDITELSCAEMVLVLQVYRQRLCTWSADERIQHVTLFKNLGSAAGASLEHIHSQLIALPIVPPVMAMELQAAEEYYAAHDACIFCKLLEEELDHRERLVVENDMFVAFCAYAGRQPYETWVVPKQHNASFQQLADSELEPLASLLQELVSRLRPCFDSLSYNLILHSAPCRDDQSAYYHWHFELIPRSTQLAGFEWGSGMHINPLSPERAAARLRDSLLE